MMKNISLIILLLASIVVAIVGALIKIITKGASGNEVMIAAFCVKGVALVALLWKNRHAIIPWLKQ